MADVVAINSEFTNSSTQARSEYVCKTCPRTIYRLGVGGELLLQNAHNLSDSNAGSDSKVSRAAAGWHLALSMRDSTPKERSQFFSNLHIGFGSGSVGNFPLTAQKRRGVWVEWENKLGINLWTRKSPFYINAGYTLDYADFTKTESGITRTLHFWSAQIEKVHHISEGKRVSWALGLDYVFAGHHYINTGTSADQKMRVKIDGNAAGAHANFVYSRDWAGFGYYAKLKGKFLELPRSRYGTLNGQDTAYPQYQTYYVMAEIGIQWVPLF